MPITSDRVQKLRDFGLSEYAARAYLALLDLGTAEARDVSSISKVPQAKIYHVLEQLHEKGLVVILPEFPKKYVPVPFEDYLNRVHDEHAKAAAQIDAERDELTEMFAVVGDTDVGNRGFFTVIRGRRNVLSKIEEIIQATKKDLFILGTSGTAARAPHMGGELARARERGIRVRMLAPIDAETLPQLEKVAKHADIRSRALDEEAHSRKVAIVVSDGVRAFLIHFVPDDNNLYAGKDIGVFTDQEAMVAAIQAIVEPHWGRAAELGAKRAEIVEGRAAPFARIYTSETEADKALAHALDDGARDVIGIVAAPVGDTRRVGRIMERLRDGGGRVRAMLNVTRADVAGDLETLLGEAKHAEVRHLAPRLVARQWVVDDREAFFAIAARGVGDDGGGHADSEFVVHTNDQAVVRSMRRHFDALWASALTLRTRRQELELFPDLQPGDLGLGVLFSQIQDAVIVTDEQGDVVLWNPAASRVFDVPTAKAIGMRLASLAEERHVESFERALARAAAAPAGSADARVVVETTCTRADGAPVHIEWLVSPIVDATARGKLVLSIGRNVSDGKRAREAEVRTQMQVVRTYERMTEAFYALDRDWRFVYRNPMARAMQLGLGDDAIDGRVIWDVFPDLAGTRFETEFRRAMEEQAPVQFEEHYARMGRWFEVNAYPSFDGLSVYFRDITQRRHTEAEAARIRDELWVTAARLHAAFDDAPVPMAVIGLDGTLARVNDALATLLDVKADAPKRPRLRDLVHPDDAAALDEALRALADGARASWQGDVRLARDASGKALAIAARVVRDAQGEPVEIFAQMSEPTDAPAAAADARATNPEQKG